LCEGYQIQRYSLEIRPSLTTSKEGLKTINKQKPLFMFSRKVGHFYISPFDPHFPDFVIRREEDLFYINIEINFL